MSSCNFLRTHFFIEHIRAIASVFSSLQVIKAPVMDSFFNKFLSVKPVAL